MTHPDTVPVADVVIRSPRPRFLPDTEALRESIREVGLLQPIVIDAERRLLCGLARLEACKSLGWKDIPCRVMDLHGPHARLAEIDENLSRYELSALERAEHIALRRSLWAELNPPTGDTSSKRKRKKGDEALEAPLAFFIEDTARQTGRAKNVIREELRIGELPEDVRDLARATPVRNNRRELLALTRMPAEEQRSALEAVKAGASRSVRRKAKKTTPVTAALDTLDDCPFDVAPDASAPLIASATSGDPGRHRDDPMSPWATPGGALERELARAQVIRLVGEVQRALQKVHTLWNDDHDSGRTLLRQATDAVDQLAHWMESPPDAYSASA
jgi:ParB-like chromosome segregation protein Spo0J